MIQDVAATRTGLRMTFTCELDPRSVQAGCVTATREKGKKGELEPVTLGPVTLATPRTIEVALPGIDEERVEHRTAKDANGNVTVGIRSPIVLTVVVKIPFVPSKVIVKLPASLLWAAANVQNAMSGRVASVPGVRL